jgi:hypothetical protein
MADMPAHLLTLWQKALHYWSDHPPELPPPLWSEDSATLQHWGLGEQLAQVRLQTRQVQLNGQRLHGMAFSYLPELLAHEAGHLLYSPASRLVHRHGLLRLAEYLPGRSDLSVLLNLWQDLLINTHLWQRHQLNLLPLLSTQPVTGLWSVILRTYERLWHQSPGSLTGTHLSVSDEADALELAEQVTRGLRAEATGLATFARICARHGPLTVALSESACADQGATREQEEARLTQLSANHLNLSDHNTRRLISCPGTLDLKEATTRIAFYRQLARPFLRPWRIPMNAVAREPIPESLSPWQFERPLTEIAWTESLLNSPRVLPGVTTVRQQTTELPEKHRRESVKALDLYLDGSSSLPNPACELSRLALCAVILTLSALHQGWQVRVTLWSGPGESLQTSDWSRTETALIHLLTDYPGGATCFPHALLTARYQPRSARPAQLVILSDQGLLTPDLNERLSPTHIRQAGGDLSLILNWPEAAPPPSAQTPGTLHLLQPDTDLSALTEAILAHV